jgi:hypothetical protein
MSFEPCEINDRAIDEFGSPDRTVLFGLGVGVRRGFDDGPFFSFPLIAIDYL